MKNLKKIVFGLLAMLVMVTSVNAESLPKAVDGTIKLENDVTLDSTYTVEDAKVIDLNEKTITAESFGAIVNNNLELTIKNGKIVCKDVNSDCVTNNYGLVLNLEGVTITAKGNALVYSGDTNVKDSTITSEKYAIYGKANGGKIVTINVENSTLDGKVKAIDYSITNQDGSKLYVNINNGEIKGIPHLSINQIITLSGNVKAPYNYVKDLTATPIYFKEGTKITLTSWADYKIVVPEGVTLIIPKDGVEVNYDTTTRYHMIVNGTLEGNIKANIYDETTKTYYGSVQNALTNSVEGSLFKVLADFEEDLNFHQVAGDGNKLGDGNDVTEFVLDLNGHTITAASGVAIEKATSLKITDTSKDGKGTISGTITNSGNLELAGGTYAKLPSGKGNTTVTGGNYTGNAAKNVQLKLAEGKELVTNEDGSVTVVDTKYAVKVTASSNGSIIVEPTEAIKGETVVITVKANAGYEVNKVFVNGTEVKANEDGTYSYVMGAENIVVSAEFKEAEPAQPQNPTDDGDEIGSTTEPKVDVEKTEGTKDVTLSTEANDVLKESLAKTEDKELQEFLANNNVTVHLESNKVAKENVAKDVVAKFESVVKNATVAEYFDLDILVTAEGQGVHYLKELSKPITLTVDLPTTLPEVAKGYTRTYYILREHNGVYEKLNATLTKDGKLSFATDKFSKYAIAYVDEEVKNPGTLDSIVSIVTLAISSLGTAGYSIKKFIRK